MLSGTSHQSGLRFALDKRMFGGLRLSPSVRLVVERRCSAACESCELEWRWALYVFLVDESAGCTAANLVVLCGRCSTGRNGAFAPLVGTRSTRDRLLTANNRRAGVQPLTASRRRALTGWQARKTQPE